MALQVWLPLNGNLNNQGLEPSSFIKRGSKDWSKGKVTEKCFGNSSQTTSSTATECIYTTTTHKWTKNFSVAFWASLPPYDPAYPGFIFTEGRADAGDYGFGARIYSSGVSCYFGNLFLTIQIPSKDSTYNWHHISMVVDDNSKMTVYLDGIENKSGTPSVLPTYTTDTGLGIGCFYYNNSFIYQMLGFVNDFRLYDRCLSQKEIKELSKGLCLHYKLSRGGENLLKNSGKYQTYTYTNNAKDGYLSLPIYVNGVSTSKQYTLSCETDGTLFQHSTGGNPPNNKYWTIWLYQHSIPFTDSDYARYNTPTCFTNSNYNHTQVGNKHYWVFTPSYANLSIRLNLYSDGVNNETVTFKNIKLEEGNACTSWLPNKSDTLYSQLGYNNIEHDCSGYGNDGTISGTLTYSNDTPRYEGSSYLTDSESCIKIGDLSKISPSGDFTFNIWFKKLTGIWSSKTWETILGGPSGFEIESKLSSTTNNCIHPYNWGGGSTTTPNSYSIPYDLDVWNMLTMVRTSSDTKFYLNGELKVTGTAGTIPSGDYFLGAWRDSVSQNYRGILSDARIYATVLSAEDIKALYNESASLCDNYTFMVREVVEQ